MSRAWISEAAYWNRSNAVESMGNWMWLYELIEERHPDLVLADPLKTKAIGIRKQLDADSKPIRNRERS